MKRCSSNKLEPSCPARGSGALTSASGVPLGPLARPRLAGCLVSSSTGTGVAAVSAGDSATAGTAVGSSTAAGALRAGWLLVLAGGASQREAVSEAARDITPPPAAPKLTQTTKL